MSLSTLQPAYVTQKKFYIESYGCQMNFNDSEIVASILGEANFAHTPHYEEASLILLNSCSIREKAETTLRNRLHQFQTIKKKNPKLLVGVLGCMAERLKKSLLEQEKIVDIVVGPDAYRSLPALIEDAYEKGEAINVLLSKEETYADIEPVRLGSNGVTAFVSIMRGCNNMCSFCVVPFTRGRERSRPVDSILEECRKLFKNGYKEVTLLGQNVDSYLFQQPNQTDVRFADLLAKVANIHPELRVRFSTSHPKDITHEVLQTMKQYDNICPYIHLPAQSGSSRILAKMNRTYDRAWYLNKIDEIKSVLPECAISTDMIVGFCSETEEDFAQTISLMQYCEYDLAYLFAYSEREGTYAARQYADDVPEAVKQQRLQRIIEVHRTHVAKKMKEQVGKTEQVLIEGKSKKNADQWCGRTPQNKMVVLAPSTTDLSLGMYVQARIVSSTSATLLGEVVE